MHEWRVGLAARESSLFDGESLVLNLGSGADRVAGHERAMQNPLGHVTTNIYVVHDTYNLPARKLGVVAGIFHW